MDDGMCSALGLSMDPQEGGGGEGAAPSGGLPTKVRADMERSFGQDFSDVRIHEGPEAAAVGAVAYTQGSDIYFQPGRFDPYSQSGRELLAHELTHVVQQRAGRVHADDGPLGKELALNADPALEAEADAAGARAARGELASVSGGGSGLGSSAAPIQRYAEVPLGGATWRLSGGNKILTQQASTHELYADPQTILDGENALQAAGSFIQLAGQVHAPGGQLGDKVQEHGLRKVTPTYRPRAPTAVHKDTPNTHRANFVGMGLPGLAGLNDNGGGDLVTPSQCIDTGRMVMGTTGTSTARNMEMPVGTFDGESEIYARQPDREFAAGEFQNMKQTPSSTESGALTALNRQLLDFLDSRELRTLADQEAAKTEVARFRLHVRKLSKDDPSKSWDLLHTLKTELPLVYTAFTRYAGIDAAAAPEVGEALVTYIAETKAGRAFKTNRRLYNALVQRLTLQVVTQLGITENTPVPEIQELIKKSEKVQHPHHQHHQALSAVSDANNMWNMHWGGVVLKDGGDYATLENDASTKDSSLQGGQDDAAEQTHGAINASWRFQLYGSARGQSFHDQMLDGGDFGDFASTMRFRRAQQGETPVAKAETHRVYGLRMPAGKSPALINQMRWELYSHDAADAAGAPAADFAAVMTVQIAKDRDQPTKEDPSRGIITDVRLLERDMPPKAVDAIDRAMEMVDVWSLARTGPRRIEMDALRERMRLFHYAVQYLVSLTEKKKEDAKPSDSYELSINQNARKLELDAEIRPQFTAYRELATSVEQRRTPSTLDGYSIGLFFQLLQFLDWNLLWHYERSDVDTQARSSFAGLRTALDKQRADARFIHQRGEELRLLDRVEEAKRAVLILNRCDHLYADVEKIFQRLFPTI